MGTDLRGYNRVPLIIHLIIVQLDKPVMAQGNVENWLGALLREALHSVHVVIRNAHIAVEDPNMDLIEFLNTFPAQASIV